MPKYRHCPFCRRNDSPPSKEDIFPKWIARLWPQRAGGFEIARFDAASNTADRTWGAKGNPGFVLTMPCQRCNNGWMSVLEGEAKPILAPMIQGRPLALTGAQQRIIAVWMLKTAIVFEFYQKRETRYFKPRDRWALYKDKALPRMMLFLARHVDRASPGDTSFFLEFPFRLKTQGAKGDVFDEAYVATFGIGQLALQLFTHRIQVPHLNFHIAGGWSNTEIQIHTNPLGVIRSWPPTMVLDAAALEAYSRRWLSLRERP